MALVTLNVYDITNTKSDLTNATIQHLNTLTKDTFNAGGIFHGGIEVHGYEYSYGYCEEGTGVYPCQPKMNSAYVFRESIPLGVTSADATKVRAIVAVMKASWPGNEYELFSKNCNTFCEAFTKALGVPPPPDWLNRFATNANGAVNALSNAKEAMREGIESVGQSVHNGLMWMASGFTLTQIDANSDANVKTNTKTTDPKKGGANADDQTTTTTTPGGTPRTIRLSNQPPPNGEIPRDIVRDLDRSVSFSPREKKKRNVTRNATAGNENKSDDSDAEDKPLDAFLLGKALAETVLERTATEVVNFISDATNLPTKIEDEMEQLKREVEKRAKEDAGRGV
ncbi:unnamed protein product [Bathycoccus prasinos]